MMLPSYLLFLMLLPLALSKISCDLNPNDDEMEDDNDDDDLFNTCSIYKSLATVLLKDDRNFYNLQKVFFPPNYGSPVFVTVKYRYFEDDNDTMSIKFNKTYFWSSSVYFFFHPVRVFQFSSLLLSDPSLRYSKVNLFLSANYSDAHDDCMVLLTQRLKLYAGHQFERFEAPIDNTYSASAHSAETVVSWYNQNKDVGIIAVVSQVVFPIFVTFFVFLFLIFIVECEPYKRGKRLQNELDSNDHKVTDNAEAGLLTKYVAAVLFHLFTLSSDGAALGHYRHVPKCIKEYYYSEPMFWAAPITMTVFDCITFILFIVIPPIVCCVLSLSKCNQKKYEYILIYSVVSPFSCIASHSYHIVFAFIINPYHATSILLIYAIIAFVNIQAFQKLFYFVNPSCPIENTCGRYLIFVFLFMLEFVFMGASIALSITLIVKLPLSNAIDDAPNHLYVIYQASVTFFAALIAFQVIFRQPNSAFDVYTKAIDGYMAKSDQVDHQLNNPVDKKKSWKELSEREKENLLAKVTISYLTKALDAEVSFIGSTDLKDVFLQTTRLSSDSPQPKAGASAVRKKGDKEVQEGENYSHLNHDGLA